MKYPMNGQINHTSKAKMLPAIDRCLAEPICRQIYKQLKEQILSGELAQGEALISTRQLASDLGVSRSTVVEAYDMLLAEGFLESRQGSQTVVANGVALIATQEKAVLQEKKPRRQINADFTTGRPDLKQFPHAQWIRLLHQAAQNLQPGDYGYTGPKGYMPLRTEIAAWLSRGRGIAVDAEDVFITAGATHALRILADLLCANHGRVIMEDPCHKGLYDTLTACNCEIVPIPADDHGIRADLMTGQERAQMVYITPSHQFPLGGILPASRRASLLRYAREQEIYLVEDDYDSEFRFSGSPISPLYALDPQRVIYIGTFSKTVFPALRIGFVLLPKELQKRWCYLRTHHDVQNPMFEQAALAEFLRTRALDRHIRTMRNRYARRRKALVDALREAFGERCEICGDAAGLHLAVRITGRRFDDDFQSLCLSCGVIVSTMESHCIAKGEHLDQLLLGYGHLEPEEIEKGVRLLAECVHTYGIRVVDE